MPRRAPPLSLSPDQRRVLEVWRDSPSTPRQVALRSQIILLASAGASSRAIARALRSTLVTVLLWRKRFRDGGAQALVEVEAGRGPERQISQQKIRKIVEATRKAPPKGRKRWTVRSMARAQGVSPTTVQRIWDEYGLKLHLGRQVRQVPEAARVGDVVGLYLNPPDKLLALVFDRKRKKPSIDAGKLPAGMERLVEALEQLEARVMGDSRWRPRQQAFFGFLRRVERTVPGRTPLHLVVDREGTHTQLYSQAWFKRRRQIRLHSTPASCKWFSWAGAWLGELSRKRSPRKAFAGAAAVERAIATYLAEDPRQPQPFAWPAAKSHTPHPLRVIQ